MINPGSIILFTNNILSHFNDSSTVDKWQKDEENGKIEISYIFFVCSAVWINILSVEIFKN